MLRAVPLRAAKTFGRRGLATSAAPKIVAVVPGDGIGPEVMDEAIKVLDAGATCLRFFLSLARPAPHPCTHLPRVCSRYPSGCHEPR